MRFASIASGSSGNCYYIGTERTHLLIDAGISNRRMEKALAELGVRPEELSGVLLTHEHSDHIAGLPLLLKKYGLPLFATAGTLEALKGELAAVAKKAPVTEVRADVFFEVGDIEVKPFRISHDAAEPVSYRLQSGGKSIAIATDMGYYDPYIVERLLGLGILLVESNHDRAMLESGPYPYYLKQRILGDRGHLSNENAGRLISELLHEGMKHVLLGHLSKENNYPDLAYEAVRLEINMADIPYRADEFDIRVAGRSEMSEILYL